MTYTDDFYELIRPGCQSSAAVVVPLILEHYQPATVADVGCGEGWWGAEFERHGCHVTGFDGGYVAHRQLAYFHDVDLATDHLPHLRVDMAVCLEVAEHLPPERAASFVAELCALAPVVVFSAAIPGQDGYGHVNCQWPDYWELLFLEHGYAMSGALRFDIWDDDRVEHWYQQNLMVAAAFGHRPPALFDTPLAIPYRLVHPTLYESKL